MNTTFICIASGPSLRQEDVDYCRGRGYVIAINDNYKLAPWADALYACDARWWEHHGPDLDFKGECWTQYPDEETGIMAENQGRVIAEFSLRWVNGRREDGLGYPHINYGMNSGYQAINLAYLWGAKKIVLLGYDCKADGDRTHWFGNHPQGTTLYGRHDYSSWRQNFARLAKDLKERDVEVVNASRDTALECFRRESLATALPW